MDIPLELVQSFGGFYFFNLKGGFFVFSYDDYNCVLTIDNMDYCTEEYISEWLDSHIDDVLFKGKMTRSYRTGKLEINITVVCYDYVVAVYIISDCSPKFIIQSLGYEKALSFERLQAYRSKV